MVKKIPVIIATAVFLSCSGDQVKQKKALPGAEMSTDPHSFAEPHHAIVKHLDLQLKVDFDQKNLSGVAIWTIENISGTDEMVFDTKGLEITKITLDEGGEETFFVLGDEEEFLGQALSVQIKPGTRKVHIHYKTGADAAALQWLDPQQTAGKAHPFLFTQSQAILARSWIPCQDSPSIRFTYAADVAVPKELLALMSAENPQEKNEAGEYHFTQKHPIPSYLMALAVGDIAFRKISGNTGVYAEPSMLGPSAYEFADMGKMVAAAEKIYGKYLWGRYDVLVLPPSFPFGGMENPLLTFLTPTIIAGDRSLVSLIAHELAHSWSGNLVTNSTWNNFWLNEGFTVYFERRIIEEIYGEEEAKMLEVLGHKELAFTVNELGDKSPDTRLNVDFTGRDPDEGVTDIAYEKGFFFLKNIEEAIGREQFDIFLKAYFNKYAFKSISLSAFENELETQIIKGDTALKSKINAYGWIYQPGLPKSFKAPVSEKFRQIDEWQKKLSVKTITGLTSKISSTNEKLYFIKTLPQQLSQDKLEAIDKEFDFTHSGNAELQCAWYTLAVKNNYAAAYSKIEEFLINVGRRKFILPIYKELLATPEGKQKAIEIYKKARPNYHSVAYNTVDDMMK
jgi:leukotriene-A4 hydrolase